MIQQLSAPELKAMVDSGTHFELVDVRNDGSASWRHRRLASARRRLPRSPPHPRPPDPLVFQCHHGIRSQAAADYCRGLGFENLFNLRGGIDAWSQLVDPRVPRY